MRSKIKYPSKVNMYTISFLFNLELIKRVTNAGDWATVDLLGKKAN